MYTLDTDGHLKPQILKLKIRQIKTRLKFAMWLLTSYLENTQYDANEFIRSKNMPTEAEPVSMLDRKFNIYPRLACPIR